MNWINGIKGGPFTEKQSSQLQELLAGLDEGQMQWLAGFLTGVSHTVGLPAGTSGAGIKAKANPSASASASPVWVLYGTHTGNSERLAKLTGEKLEAMGMTAKVSSMATFKPRDLKKVENLLVIVSTHGIGEPPIQAEEFYNFLHSKKAPELKGLKYSVLALGDSSYAQFCQTGKDFDLVLEKLGAERIRSRVDCDVDYEDEALQWIDEVLPAFNGQGTHAVSFPINGVSGGPAEQPKSVTYTRKNPFEAPILDKINLNGRGSAKETLHLELSLEDSGLAYAPGDALGVYATNANPAVEAILNATQLSGSEEVETYRGRKNLKEALTYDYELSPLTSVTLDRYATLSQSTRLQKILADNLSVQAYLHGRDILDLLKEVRLKLSPEQLISVLRKNTPRMYSIASSQQAVEDEVHLLVSVVRYEAYGRCKEGLCSSFLADRIKEDETVKVFVDPNTRFKLPEDPDRPVIMVGPGTGVAPFRAFLQHREIEEARGKSWLFFGDQHFTTDFLYQTEWQQYLKEGVLSRLDVAFSRDQDKKLYVQHRMLEQGKTLFQWLEEGAHFYVCGDAQRMAKDVHQTLKEIIKIHGSMSMEKAEEYVKHLQVSDRYQTDVY